MIFQKNFNKGEYSRKDFSKAETNKKIEITCYECDKPGHIKTDCLEI